MLGVTGFPPGSAFTTVTPAQQTFISEGTGGRLTLPGTEGRVAELCALDNVDQLSMHGPIRQVKAADSFECRGPTSADFATWCRVATSEWIVRKWVSGRRARSPSLLRLLCGFHRAAALPRGNDRWRLLCRRTREGRRPGGNGP